MTRETNKFLGAHALIDALQDAHVTRIFTLSGNHVMPVFDAAIDSGIELIHVRHEAATVHMADAYARLTDSVGIAMVTGGPGHANAVSALYTAMMGESPVVLLSGHAPLDLLGKGAFQEMAQAEIAAPLAKASWMCRSANDVAGDMRKAMKIARSGRPGPVHLSLPTDCLEQPATIASGVEESTAVALADRDASYIVGRLLAAQSPLILTGPAAMTKRGRERARALEDALGIPVVGMESPRGVADPSLGAFAEILAQADCILLLGKRLDFTLKFGAPPAVRADCEFMLLDAEAREIDRTSRAVAPRPVPSARAELHPAIDALIAHAKGAKGGWLDEVRSAIAYRPAAWDNAQASGSQRLHPVEALRPLQSLLDAHPDSVFISDGGEFGQWAQACLTAPNRVINGVAGAIGPAFPFAVGASAAKPGVPIVAVMGDGTFGFHCAEIDTAVRAGLPFLAIVGNDARWNAEYQIQVRDYGAERAKGCELLPLRYDEVAKAFGGHGDLVTEASELLPAAKRALASGKPACLNVMIEGVAAPVVRR
jgi:acetolactate synthase I/II/III large subunit